MTILFVDDDSDDTEVFSEAVMFLNSSEFIHDRHERISCLTAENGRVALELLSSLQALPDYIFLDINMPLMGGRELLTYLKSSNSFSSIPIVMLSTTCRPSDVEEFKTIGAVDCIRKPNGFKDLMKILSKYVYNDIVHDINRSSRQDLF